MSGGAWGYQSKLIQSEARSVSDSLKLLAAIEHELDWGVSGDTCQRCAELRVIAALKEFFEAQRCYTETIKAVIHSHSANRCPRCHERGL